MNVSLNRIAALGIAALFSAACSDSTNSELANPLPSIGAAFEVTVSGLSSGAYMATQLHVALSERVTGAGLAAGGPWGCAQGRIQQALGPCISGEGLDIAALVQQAKAMEAEVMISPTTNLADDDVFLFHGTNDAVVSKTVAMATGDFYRAISDGVSIVEETGIEATHGWPTENTGAACDEFASPFINACGYDLAGKILESVYDDLKPPVAAKSEVVTFSQGSVAGMAEEGYAYIPSSCKENNGCRVHVFLHGCNQGAEKIGTTLIDSAGFNEWAESNNLVIVYPQAEASQFAPQNPLGCWDWWGYSGEDYLSNEAPQIKAIKKMLNDLAL